MNRSAVVMLAVLVVATVPGGAAPARADFAVSDLDSSSLIRVDSTNGNRSVLSGGATGSGTALQNPEGIAVDGSGNPLVVDNGVVALFHVDGATGNRTIVSGAGVGSGQAFVLPFGVTINSGGQVFVADAGDAAGDGFVVRVDPVTGARTLISGLGAGSGDPFGNIRGIVALNGSLIVSDLANQALYRVDPVTGARTIFSDATHGTGTALTAPLGLAIDGSGNILVADPAGAALFRVGPPTGNRTLLTGTGPPFALPSGVILDSLGRIAVTDSGDSSIPALPALFLVDPTTGNRSIFSDATHGSGVSFQNLDIGIGVVPGLAVPEPASLVLTGAGALCLLGYRWGRKNAAERTCRGFPSRFTRFRNG